MADAIRPPDKGEPPAKPRWFQPTPGKMIAGLLVVELALPLINASSGRVVLTGIAIFVLTILVGLVWFVVALLLRRRFQFGILTLLGLMLAVGIVGGWFSWKMKMAKRQREAVDWIRQAGGLVFYEHRNEDFRLQPSELRPVKPASPAWMRRMLGDDFFSDVIGVAIRLDDGDPKTGDFIPWYIGNSMSITRGELAHKELAHLGDRLPGLRYVWLSQGYPGQFQTWEDFALVDGEALRHLSKLHNLRTLRFVQVRITDSELPCLTGLAKLEELKISNAQITDAGLKHLSELTKLEELQVYGTQVTDQGIGELQKALPNCHVRY